MKKTVNLKIKFILFFIIFLGQTITVASVNTSYKSELTEMPVQRIINNLKKIIASKNDDSYSNKIALARAYAIAYAVGADGSATVKNEYNNYYSAFETHSQEKPVGGKIRYNSVSEITPEIQKYANKNTRTNYLQSAIKSYEQAFKIDTESDFVSKLGYSWCLLQANRKKDAKKLLISMFDKVQGNHKWGVISRLNTYNDDKNKDLYKWEYDVQLEALNYLMPLLNVKSEKDKISVYTKKMEDVKTIIANISNGSAHPPRIITPLIFSFSNNSGDINQLISLSSSVKFNLDVSYPKKWGWPNKDTGILVYDKNKSKKLLSGIDLFGNFSFFIFWANGFQALASLDDDGNGIIDGAELSGIYVWFDENQDGLVDDTERKSLVDLGIVGLKTNYTQHPQSKNQLLNPEGVLLSNGQVIPLHDWFAEEQH